MPRHKRKFIDKKNAVTFHLVHRSQQDPMLVSEDSQHVLLPAAKKPREKQLEEQREFGVYFDDDYNYLQHLKEADEACVLEEVETFRMPSNAPARTAPDQKLVVPDQKLVLPSTVFASAVETNVGLLNKAAPNTGPKIDWDPDIVATLDGDFDYDDPEGELEDDFFITANSKKEGEEESEEDDDDSDVDSNAAEGSDEGSGGYFMEEETKSHFTNYSMTSSVVTRSEALMDLDDQFEKFFEQYEESEIGALDFDNLDGNIDETCEQMSRLIQDYQDSKAEGKMDDILKTATVKSADICDLNSGSEDEEVEVEEDKGEKWDCESILSTYSNLYNRPKLIEEPKKEKKIKLNRMGIPADSFSRPGLVKKDLEAAMNSSVISDISQITCRDKNESKEEKKNRKMLIKEQKKERRIEKKLNKEAFKEAHLKQQKEVANIHKNMKAMLIA